MRVKSFLSGMALLLTCRGTGKAGSLSAGFFYALEAMNGPTHMKFGENIYYLL